MLGGKGFPRMVQLVSPVAFVGLSERCLAKRSKRNNQDRLLHSPSSDSAFPRNVEMNDQISHIIFPFLSDLQLHLYYV